MIEKINQCGISITIHQSVKDCIYRNGVFPAQGVRPALSTINAMLGNTIPSFIVHAIEQKVVEFTIKSTGTALTAKIGKKIFSKPVEGAIDKKEQDAQLIMLTSVHESGHAIVYAALYKTSPVQIIANSSNEGTTGWVGIHNNANSKKDIDNLICVYLAGLVAEEWVFGDENRTNGCRYDLDGATQKAAKAIRRWAMNSRLSYSVNQYSGGHSNFNFDLESSNAEIEDMLQSAKKQAIKILIDNRQLFEKVVDILSSSKEITPKEFRELAAKRGLSLSIIEPKQTIYPGYVDQYKKFRSRRDEVKNGGRII